MPDLTHLVRDFLLTYTSLGAGKNLPRTLRSMLTVRLIGVVIGGHVVVKLGQSVQHFSNFNGLYRGEFLPEKGMHVCLGYLTGKPQRVRCSADPLTRRHTVHSVIIADFPSILAQRIAGGYLIYVVLVAVANAEFVDGHHAQYFSMNYSY